MYLIKKIVHFYWIGSAFLMITIQERQAPPLMNKEKHNDGKNQEYIYTKQKNMIT